MALDIDTGGLRRTGELVHAAGEVLHLQLDADVPACGGDEVSQALMDNLNAWQRWLVQHVKAGAQQAFSAAEGIDSSASGFEAQDSAAAAAYPGGGHAAAAPPAVAPTAGMPTAAAAPAGPPPVSPIPDISGRDGEQLALALQAGAGPGPAQAKAAQWEGVAAQAAAAHTALMDAWTQLAASGEAAMSGPLLTRLGRAIGWAQGVATHASALASGYSAAAGAHTAASTAVGHPTVWRATKVNLAQARADPFGAPRAQAYQTQLTGMQHSAGVSMAGYHTTGTAVSTPPGTLPGPGLAPNTADAPGSPSPTHGDQPGQSDPGDDPLTPTPKADDGAQTPASPSSGQQSGLQDMLGSLMGALGPLMQSFGQSNPLQSLGQLGQQIGQQAGGLGKGAHPAIKPAALTHAHPGGAGAHKGGGGGSPIKPAGIGGGGVHSAALTAAPASSTPAAPIKPAASTAASPSGAGGGMGMMPMGHRGEDAKSSKVRSYEQPIPEVETQGRPGVVGGPAKPEPVIAPETHNAVKARIAARKKDTATRDDT